MSHIEEVATRLKGLRDALGLTAEEIAAVCGVDVETYLKYESAKADISISSIKKDISSIRSGNYGIALWRRAEDEELLCNRQG